MGAFFGLVLHAIGGFAAGSFYMPFKLIKGWSWETSWTVLGIAAWIITPLVMAYLTVPDFYEVLTSGSSSAKYWAFFFGILWGIGGLTFGLTMRYLGIGLGMLIALGFTAAFGTLIPPIHEGRFFTLFGSTSGLLTLLGVLLCLVGIVVAGKAGMRKESELSSAEKKMSVAEYNLSKGMVIAIVSGILSACFAFGMAAGKPLAAVAMEHGTRSVFQNNIVLVWILWGGFLTNFIWTVALGFRNKTNHEYRKRQLDLKRNYLLASLGGVTWYFQFFFYGMGTTFLGEAYEFASWTLHMAFIILFSTLWGLYFKEWRGVSKKTMSILYLGLSLIIGSAILIGLGNTGFE